MRWPDHPARGHRLYLERRIGSLGWARNQIHFRMDAHPKVVNLAEALPKRRGSPSSGSRAMRLPRLRDASPSGSKKASCASRVMRTRCWSGEDIAEMEYQPRKCSRPYRLIIVRKNISVQKGEQVLFDEIRYFFYITNRSTTPRSKSSVWPTDAAIRRTSSSSSKMESTPCACQSMIC